MAAVSAEDELRGCARPQPGAAAARARAAVEPARRDREQLAARLGAAGQGQAGGERLGGHALGWG